MEQKRAIGHLIATNFFGGPEKQIIEHACRINERRFAVTVFSFREHPGPNELLQKAREKNIPAVELPVRGPFDPSAIGDLVRSIKKMRIDILCTHGYKSNVIGHIAARTAGIPHIAVSRGWTGESRKIRLYEYLDKRFLKFADHVVAVSEGQRKKVVAAGAAPERVSVIYNGVTVGAVEEDREMSLRSVLGLDGAATLVVSAGRLSAEKNFSGLIDAARLVTAKECTARFVVFGEGVLRKELEQKVRRAGLEHFFFLPGFRRDFRSLLDDADIFVLPSFTEGLPNVVLEACAKRKPVVATAVGGTPEVIQHGSTGFMVAPHETEKMADYILMLLRDPSLRRTMGACGYEYVREYFNFDIQTKRFEALYDDVYGSFYHHRYAC
ncbi:MAG: glycosyltransferase [Nitrospirota bacterium]